jgi:hypothetical protein
MWVQTAFGHDDYIQALAFSAHTDTLFSAGLNDTLLQWDLQSMSRPVRDLTAGMNVYSCVGYYLT